MSDPIRAKRLIIEGLTILLSILTAFGIDAWWDWSRDRGDEAELLGQLRAEFGANLEVMDETVYRHERSISSGESLLGMVRTTPDVAVEAQLDTLFRWALWPAHYNPATGALDATISSGRLDLIRNDTLRNRLAGWDGVLSDLLLDEQTRRNWVFDHMIPLVAEFGVDASYNEEPIRPDYEGALASVRIIAGLSKSVGYTEHLLTHHVAARAEAEALLEFMSRVAGSR